MDKTEKASFGFLITDVTRLMRKQFDRRALRFDLTRAQWRALKRVHHGEGITQNELAEFLEMEPIAVGGVIDDMEQISTELFQQAQRGISAAEMKSMIGVLARMKDNLNALDDADATP